MSKMAYHEPKDPITKKAIKHQEAALKKKGNDLSNVEIIPTKEIELTDIDKKQLKTRIGDEPERSPLNNLTYNQMNDIGKVVMDYFKERTTIEIEDIIFAGSRVKGYAAPDSDLDLVIIVKNKNLWSNAAEFTQLINTHTEGLNPLLKKFNMPFDIMILKHENDLGFAREWNTKFSYNEDIIDFWKKN